MINSSRALTMSFRALIPVALLLLMAACTSEPEPATVASPDVQATVQAEVAAALASAPTSTPWPTNTPYPTHTPYPTATPYPPPAALPTNTPWPTHTPYPTATPYPTHTPYPTPTQAATQTPLPTYTPYPTPVRATTATQQVAPTPTVPVRPHLESDSYVERDTTDRSNQILSTHILGGTNCDRVADLSRELSREQDNAILKVYDMRIVVSNSRRVECAGEAKWSRGDNTSIIIFVESDGDGDEFYGYRFQSRGFEGFN